MSYESVPSGVSMRDVLSALEALHEDQGATARVVLYRRVPPKGEAHIQITVQACGSDGRLLPDVPAHGSGWPNNNFRTLTQAIHWYIGCLYDSLEYMRYESARRAAKELQDAAPRPQ